MCLILISPPPVDLPPLPHQRPRRYLAHVCPKRAIGSAGAAWRAAPESQPRRPRLGNLQPRLQGRGVGNADRCCCFFLCRVFCSIVILLFLLILLLLLFHFFIIVSISLLLLCCFLFASSFFFPPSPSSFPLLLGGRASQRSGWAQAAPVLPPGLSPAVAPEKGGLRALVLLAAAHVGSQSTPAAAAAEIGKAFARSQFGMEMKGKS